MKIIKERKLGLKQTALNKRAYTLREMIIHSIREYTENHGYAPLTLEHLNCYLMREGLSFSGRQIAIAFGTWENALWDSYVRPYEPHEWGIFKAGFGHPTTAKDGWTYRSKVEARFVDKFLFPDYEYRIEPKYPPPYRYLYDWYLPELDLYIELAGGLQPHRINIKRDLNKFLDRKLLIVHYEEVYKYDSLKRLCEIRNIAI